MDAHGTQSVVGTVHAAGLEPHAKVTFHPGAGMTGVAYGPTLTYAEDRAALDSFVSAWRQARHRGPAVGLPTYADGPGRADPTFGVCLLVRAAGPCPIDVVALARGVSADGLPSVRVRVGRLLVYVYDLAALLHLGGLWEQAAAYAHALPPRPRPACSRPTSAPAPR